MASGLQPVSSRSRGTDPTNDTRSARPRPWLRAALLLLLALLPAAPLRAADVTPVEARQRVDVTEHLGDTLPLDLPFVDRAGRAVTLGDYYRGDMPVVLVLAYYECPMLCTIILNGLGAVMQASTDLVPGRDYRVVTVSIDPSEGPELARAKHSTYTATMSPEAAANWHFLTGRHADIKTLADAVGFDYFFDTRNKQFAHPAVLTMGTPDGVISNYLYGTSYAPDDFQTSLVMAQAGRIAGVRQLVGGQLDTSLRLTDASGQTFTLAEMLGDDRPLVLMLEHAASPTETRPFTLGLVRNVANTWFAIGPNYRVLTVDLDPERGQADLAARAAELRARAGGVPAESWRFARGDAATVQALADAVGVGYMRRADGSYTYPDVLVAVSPSGMISSYLNQTEGAIRDLKLSMLDAGEGRIGSLMDRFILSCFHYDPEAGGYVMTAVNLMRLGGVLIVLALGSVMALLWRRELRRSRPAESRAPDPAGSAEA